MHDNSGFLYGILLMIFALAALQVLVPIAAQLADNAFLWLVRRPVARARQWHTLNPVEQNLQRASHGAAYIVLPIAAAWLIGLDKIASFLSGVAPGARFAAGVAAAVWFACALARLVAGWRRSGSVRDGLLTGRAFLKLAGGVVLFCCVPHHPLYPVAGVAVNALLFLALWLGITGLVRLVLLVRPAGRALPEVQGDIAAHEFDWNG